MKLITSGNILISALFFLEVFPNGGIHLFAHNELRFYFMNVPFFAFRDFPIGINQLIQDAVALSIEEGNYILGSQVRQFEKAFSKFLDSPFVTGTGSGYDSLMIGLKAMGIQKGDEVVLPANGFIATANAVSNLGARPVLADPGEAACNLSANEAQRYLTPRTKAIIPVHLYGQSCEMEDLLSLAEVHNLWVLEDFAQSQGARYKGKMTGTFGHVGATSFYPVKNLGALGDAGAIVTGNEEFSGFIRKYHNYGQSSKYEVEILGVNSRIDTLQAAVLLQKLPLLPLMNRERQRIAGIYHGELAQVGDLILPFSAPHCEHVYHVFSVRTNQRDALQAYLAEKKILTLVHYPVPIHLQKGYRFLGYTKGDFPVSEHLSRTSLSLPIFPGLREEEQRFVIESIKKFFKRAV
jgi:dTDP-4-amino-4,6-dideoxygalactose transaminase